MLQQRSAGLCDDATNAAANPLQRRLLHQILLQQRSVRLRTAATRRNPLQQRIACCNSAHYHNTARCTTAQSDATEHCVLQQSTIPSLHSATRRRSCCGSAVQRCSLFCNSVAQQRNRFQYRAVSCSRSQPAVKQPTARCNLLWRLQRSADKMFTVCHKQQHNRLQRTAICCNAVLSVATDLTPLKPVAAVATQRRQHGHSVCNKQQHNRLQRSATCCTAVPSVATDHTPLKPVAAIATQRRQHGHGAPQHRSTTGCNAAHPVATQSRPLQQTSLR